MAASSGVAGVVCSGVRRAVYAPWCRGGAETLEPLRVSEALAVRGGLTVPEGRLVGPAAVPALGEGAQADPAGQRVQPGFTFLLGRGAPAVLPVRDRQDGAERFGGRFVVAEHGEAVGEEPVEIRLVPYGRSLRRGVGCSAVRPVCAGGVRRGLQPAARHPATVGKGAHAPSAP